MRTHRDPFLLESGFRALMNCNNARFPSESGNRAPLHFPKRMQARRLIYVYTF